MSNIEKIIDRVRKLLALSEGAGSEHEAASAAGRATALIAEYQLSEAQLRVDDGTIEPEPIAQSARLEPDAPLINRKRVAWRETIALAVAKDLGVKMHWKYNTTWSNKTHKRRKHSDVCGFGRESAIQTWRYTCQYLWNTIDTLAEAQTLGSWQSVRAYRNAYRVGCASRIAERIFLDAKARKEQPMAANMVNDEPSGDASSGAGDGVTVDRSKALAIVERDREEVEAGYKEYSAKFGTVGSIGAVSVRSAYDAGRAAGDSVRLVGGGKGLKAGTARLKGGR